MKRSENEVTITRGTLKELCQACQDLEARGWEPVSRYKKIVTTYDRRSTRSFHHDGYEKTCYKIRMRRVVTQAI